MLNKSVESNPFVIKIHNKVGLEGPYLNIIKPIYEKPTANVILTGEKLRDRNKTRVSIPITSTQHSTGSPIHNSQTRKRNKSHPNW